VDRVTSDATQLRGVASTTLWTLYNRASEAARPDGVLRDPVAIDLLDAIDYPFQAVLGEPDQSHPLRAVAFDRAVTDYIRDHPDGTVVALGEGLETGFWRTDNGRIRWVSLDFPEVVRLRRKLLPACDRIRHLAGSALDLSWMDKVDASAPVFVNAQGLLPYLPPVDAIGLIRSCAAQFRGGQMIFDLVPPWHSKRSKSGTARGRSFTVPPVPFGMTARDALRLAEAVYGVESAAILRPPAGRGWRRRAVATVGALPVVRNHRFAICLLRFAP
jgi:O-methyltransferase involved in polyketide biosynthesis